MAYGKIDLTAADIDTLRVRLEQVADEVKETGAAAGSDDERAFYEQSAGRVAQWRSFASKLREGRHGFSESELQSLRGMLVERNHGELARRCVAAKAAGDPAHGALEDELDRRLALQAKLERPFTLDRSQDPDPDEDEEGDE